MNAGQHTVKYKREGDYSHLRPIVSPVEYQNSSKMLLGTCEKCVFNSGQHSLECLWEKHKKYINSLPVLISKDSNEAYYIFK